MIHKHFWLIHLKRHSLRWRHNGRDGVSNHQPRDCLLNRLFRRRSKETSKLRVTGVFPAQWPVTRKMFQFDDVIMLYISVNRLAMLSPAFRLPNGNRPSMDTMQTADIEILSNSFEIYRQPIITLTFSWPGEVIATSNCEPTWKQVSRAGANDCIL